MEIAQAKAEIGAEGIGCEPASAVTLAGLKKLLKQGFVKPDESVVLVLTGNLLKDPDYTIEFHREGLFQGTVHEDESAALKALISSASLTVLHFRAFVGLVTADHATCRQGRREY